MRNARQAFQDSFRCLHLPGHFISSLGRVMHVPELCKMHNQAFKYTPSEWTMCTHVQYVHVCVWCCVKHRCTIICTQTQNAYYCKTSGYYFYVHVHVYTMVYTAQILLQYSLQLHCNRHLCNGKESSVVHYSKCLVVAELCVASKSWDK